MKVIVEVIPSREMRVKAAIFAEVSWEKSRITVTSADVMRPNNQAEKTISNCIY